MKRSISLYLMILLTIAFCSGGLISQDVKALTLIQLKTPADSTKVTTGTPTFTWDKQGPSIETPTKFQIQLATDINFNTIVWDDTTILGTARSKVYDGASLVEWTTYYWRMRVQIDSLSSQGHVIYWQNDYSSTFTFFHTTATLIKVPSNVPTIQKGIYWAAAKDTILVEPGTYYENIRFYKKNVLLTSRYLYDKQDTAIINQTIIDGSKLTRGEENGSVIFFTSAVDSTNTLRGFTIRGGTGTTLFLGIEKKISGGGILCDVGSSPTIAYNVITGNQVVDDGGGIFINAAAPNILYNIITDNSAIKGSGGAIECRFSIEVKSAPGLKQGGQKGEEDLFAPEESQLDMDEEEIKNSLNPRDATEVYPVNTPPRLAKTAQNTEPVALITWYARRDTVVEREKYLPGDTLVFDGSDSYDPDGGDDHITYWQWRYLRNYRCDRDPSTSPISFSEDTVAYLPITESNQLGIIEVYLEVRDTAGFYGRAFSEDTIEVNIQYPPHVDAGEDFINAPGDTVRLDGSASCDINPTDVLVYSWTQLDGPSVVIENADLDTAYFVIPLDNAYVSGDYEFKLRISDGMAADSATIQGVASNPPVPVCQDDPVYGDTLVGYTAATSGSPPVASDTFFLDACSSYDPDIGDRPKKFFWIPAGRWTLTKTGWVSQPFNLTTNSNLCSQKKIFQFGGLLKLRLAVEDSLGVVSRDTCVVFYSLQTLPFADAGRDTVIVTGTSYSLTGKAYETNPDQRNTLKYNWRVASSPTPLNIIPSDTAQTIFFSLGLSGVYKIHLTVDDRFGLSEPDEVVIKANKRPDVVLPPGNLVPHAFEGDTVHLDASATFDPDSAIYGRVLTFAWSLKDKPSTALVPQIVDATKSVAKFVPYGTGQYVFKVVVHDSLSKRQPLDSVSATGNVAFLTVNVDSTYAYPIIKGNLISENYSGSRGGGIDCNQSSPDIFDNIFFENHSELSGGAICARSYSTPQIKNNIFFGNISNDSTGGAIADLKGQLAPSATRGFRKNMTIQNNDFWNNRGGVMYQASGNIADNIYDYPRLVNPRFGDFTLECSSPCELLSIGKLIFFRPCNNVDPLQMVSFSMFQNPVATTVAHFIINTDAPLKHEPVAYVEIGNNSPSPVYFTSVSPKCFRGSFVFTSSGDAKVSILASSVLEVDTMVTETFGVQLIPGSGTGTLISPDRLLKTTFPEGSVENDLYATCISVSKDSKYNFKEDTDLETIGESYQLSPSISFNKDLTVSFPLSDLDVKDKDKSLFSIYRYEDGKWNRLESYVDGNSICANVRELGVYRLIYDPTGKHIAGRPATFELYQNHPNPFNPETQIRYDLPVSGHVNLTIYNVLGQKVKVLVDQFQDVGRKSIIWDGHDDTGGEAASGIYFYKMKVENFVKTRKMVLVK